MAKRNNTVRLPQRATEDGYANRQRVARGLEPELPPDAGEVFERYQKNEERLQRLGEHKFSLAAVERLKEELEPEELNVLMPFIEMSNSRNDFLYPHQMSRVQAQKYIDETRGTTSEVWSLAEINVCTDDKKLYDEYRDEILRAQAEKRIIFPPNGSKQWHFDGEDNRSTTGPQYEAFKERLNAKLARIDNYKKAKALIAETCAERERLTMEKHGPRVILNYLTEKNKKLVALHHERYSVAEIEGFTAISNEIGELQGA